MKNIFKYLFSAVSLIMVFTACEKKAEDLPLFSSGTAPVLTSSADAVAASPDDSSSQVITFNWSDPKYAAKNSKYIFQIDVAGNEFSHPLTRTLTDSLGTSFTGKEINDMLLGFGFDIEVPGDVEARVISSYANNNEQYTSNTLTLQMTAYKIPAKVELPPSEKLFLTGDATAGGWVNDPPVPTQEFSRLDETTWAGIFNLVGNKEFIVLRTYTSWDEKYALQDASVPGVTEGGDFGYHVGADFDKNFKSPATDGLYRIVLDFQKGKYTITPFTGGILPTELFITGGATAGGWQTGGALPEGGVPVPSQQFTRVNSSVFEISLPLIGGEQYVLLPMNGDWSHKFAVQDNSIPGYDTNGEFGYDFGANFPAPATSGNYKINVNFAAPTTTAGASGMFKVTSY